MTPEKMTTPLEKNFLGIGFLEGKSLVGEGGNNEQLSVIRLGVKEEYILT